MLIIVFPLRIKNWDRSLFWKVYWKGNYMYGKQLFTLCFVDKHFLRQLILSQHKYFALFKIGLNPKRVVFWKKAIFIFFLSFRTMSPLAELYSTSTLEHHHFDQCIMILSTEVGLFLNTLKNMLAELLFSERFRLTLLIVRAVLGLEKWKLIWWMKTDFERKHVFQKWPLLSIENYRPLIMFENLPYCCSNHSSCCWQLNTG